MFLSEILASEFFKQEGRSKPVQQWQWWWTDRQNESIQPFHPYIHSWPTYQLWKVLQMQTTVRWLTQNFTAAGLRCHVMAQVESQWSFAVDAWVQFQDSAGGVCGGQSTIEIRFSPNTSVYSYQLSLNHTHHTLSLTLSLMPCNICIWYHC